MRRTPVPWSRRGFLQTGAIASAGLLAGSGRLRLVTPAAATAPPGDSIDDVLALRPVLQDLVREMSRRFPYASAGLMRSRGVSIDVDNQTSSVDTPWPSQGAVFRVWNGRWAEEAATNDLNPDALRRVARELGDRVRLQPGGEDIDPGPSEQRDERTAAHLDPRTIPMAELFARVQEQHERARALDDDLLDCEANLSYTEIDEIFVDPARTLTQSLLRVRNGVTFYTSNGRETASNTERRGVTGGLEKAVIDDDELAACAGDAHRLLEAGRVEPGEHVAITEGSVTGTLAHESFGHGVELDMFIKDRALAESFIGRRVGSDLVNIVDDPSLEGAFGSFYFDHEGERSGPTEIVRDGVFLRGISDLMSARGTNVAPSANGRRQDYSRKVYARMSNTFFAPGESELAAMIASTPRGVLLEKFTHGMEDPRGWGILVGAHIGREIVDGKLTGRLFSPVTITGYVPDVLNSVDAVSTDFGLHPGTCGKGHKEFVAVGMGGPHLRLTARLS